MNGKIMTGKFYLAKDLIYESLVQHGVSSNLKTLVPKKENLQRL
jgi:hypothetical protein